jgi:hypothetical protein
MKFNKNKIYGGTNFKEGDIVMYKDMIYIINDGKATNININEIIDIKDDMKLMENIISTNIEGYEISLIFKMYNTRDILCLKINNDISYLYTSNSDIGDWKACIVLKKFQKTRSYVDGSSLYYKIQYFIDSNYDKIYSFKDFEFPLREKICSAFIYNKELDNIFGNKTMNKHILFNTIYEICSSGACFAEKEITLLNNKDIYIEITDEPSLKNVLIFILKSIVNESNIDKNFFKKIYDCIGAYVALFIDTIDQTEKIDITLNDEIINKNIYESSQFEVKKSRYNIYNCTFNIPNKKKINAVFNNYFEDYIINDEYKQELIKEISKLSENDTIKDELIPVIIGTNTYILNYYDIKTQTQINDVLVENPFTVCKEFSLLGNIGINNNYYVAGIFVSKPLEYMFQCNLYSCEELLSEGEYYLLLPYMKNIFNRNMLKNIFDIKNSYIKSDTVDLINSNLRISSIENYDNVSSIPLKDRVVIDDFVFNGRKTYKNADEEDEDYSSIPLKNWVEYDDHVFDGRKTYKDAVEEDEDYSSIPLKDQVVYDGHVFDGRKTYKDADEDYSSIPLKDRVVIDGHVFNGKKTYKDEEEDYKKYLTNYVDGLPVIPISEKSQKLINIIYGNINDLSCDNIIDIIDNLNNNNYDVYDHSGSTFNKQLTISDIAILCAKLFMRTICLTDETIRDKITDLLIKFNTPSVIIFPPSNIDNMIRNIKYFNKSFFSKKDIYIILEFLYYFYPKYILYNTTKSLLKYLDDNEEYKFMFDTYTSTSGANYIPIFNINKDIFNDDIKGKYTVGLNIVDSDVPIHTLYFKFDKDENKINTDENKNIKTITLD